MGKGLPVVRSLFEQDWERLGNPSGGAVAVGQAIN